MEEGMPILHELLRKGDWLVNVDMKDVLLNCTSPPRPNLSYLRLVIEGLTY